MSLYKNITLDLTILRLRTDMQAIESVSVRFSNGSKRFDFFCALMRSLGRRAINFPSRLVDVVVVGGAILNLFIYHVLLLTLKKFGRPVVA